MYLRVLISKIKSCATLVLITLCTLAFFEAKTQDFHYSQFYNAPMSVNPALTGIFNGDERISGSLRDQWRSVPVPWFNFSLGYDRKFYPKKAQNGFFGGGLYFNYDTQGDSNLKLANLNLSGSYTRILNKTNLITVGALVGFSSRAVDATELTWDRFWDPARNSVDPGRGSGETSEFERFSFIETALGLNYRWQKTSRTKLDLGVGAFHLTKPQSKFIASTVNQDLPIRLSLYGIFSQELSDKLDLQLDALYQKQNSYDELLFGTYLNFYLNQQRGKEFQFRAGLGYRTRKAIFPKVGIEFNNFFIAASYDIYLDQFSKDHSGRGPELHVRYIIKHVKPLGKFKVCPIF